MAITKKHNGVRTTHRQISLARTMVRKKKILVVDDDPVVRDVFYIIFEQAGYDVDLMPDGNRLLKNKFSTPDLFLIDKLLSGVNGLDVCRHLKSLENTRHIPVIMISASPGLAVQSADAGADGYIEKPFDRMDLLNLVAKHINRTKTSRRTKTT